MKFKEAFNLYENGIKVRRKSWTNKDYFLDKKDKDQLEDPCLSIKDIIAEDWVRNSKQGGKKQW